MLPVDDALRIVLDHCRPLPPVQMALAGALQLVLAESVASDLDSPPFDKAMMDGYAVRRADLGDGRVTLPVAGEVMAGERPPALPLGPAIPIIAARPVPHG